LTRREFVRQSTAVTLLLGFPLLDQAAEPDKHYDELLGLAKERMKKENKPAVVIVFPADRERLRSLENDLARLVGGHHPECGLFPKGRGDEVPLLGTGSPEAQLLLLQAVFVCLPAAQAAKAFPEVKTDTAVLLLGLDGKVAASFVPKLDGNDFQPPLAELIYGKDGERLAAAVRTQRAALGKDLSARFDAAIRDLQSDQFASRQAAVRQLEELAPRATALLAEVYRGRRPLEMTRRLAQIVNGLFAPAPADKPSLRLPYGTHWVAVQADCAGGFSETERVACGLSGVAPPTRRFLRFLTENPK
jgi:hypothetical protein